jgi:hypothetical protein
MDSMDYCNGTPCLVLVMEILWGQLNKTEVRCQRLKIPEQTMINFDYIVIKKLLLHLIEEGKLEFLTALNC